MVANKYNEKSANRKALKWMLIVAGILFILLLVVPISLGNGMNGKEWMEVTYQDRYGSVGWYEENYVYEDAGSAVKAICSELAKYHCHRTLRTFIFPKQISYKKEGNIYKIMQIRTDNHDIAISTHGNIMMDGYFYKLGYGNSEEKAEKLIGQIRKLAGAPTSIGGNCKEGQITLDSK